MKRYPCQSQLTIWCRESVNANGPIATVTILLHHHVKHVQYIDVALPDGAAELIRSNVEWLTPVAMVAQVQAAYPNVTAAQIHSAWMDMSQLFWRRDDMQLPSTNKLLKEHGDDVDIFTPFGVPDGVEMLCWGMKRIISRLKGKIFEVGVDATCS